MTARDFRLPDLGEGLTDAEIVRWMVAVGDQVLVDQPVVEVVTAKASVELPSPYEGTVVALHCAVGDVVGVGLPLLAIGAEDDALAVAVPGEAAAEAAAPSSQDGGGSGSVLVGYGTRPERRRRRRGLPGASAGASAGAADPVVGEPAAAAESPAPADSAVAAVTSPVVRRLARDRGIDLTTLAGSGPHGVITRADVETAAPAGAGARATRQAAGQRRLPIRGLHRQMAELVTRSRREIPEATVWVDVDASSLLQARKDLAGDEAAPALVSLIGRFCVLGLQRYPALNSAVAGDEIVVFEEIGLGFAAQTDSGLVVPVVHDAGRLSLADLDSEVRRLSATARSGRLTTRDVTGGTFTVNNYGVFGVDGSAAI
ncbi:MAG TPA: dihydrolipoamide acetyltransferase family protein, partial [Acidimicrobiales bacterium]|nr:dihydrolipoamide acetyltransferase family protein [Acidimicrobiales bacterium]